MESNDFNDFVRRRQTFPTLQDGAGADSPAAPTVDMNAGRQIAISSPPGPKVMGRPCVPLSPVFEQEIHQVAPSNAIALIGADLVHGEHQLGVVVGDRSVLLPTRRTPVMTFTMGLSR